MATLTDSFANGVLGVAPVGQRTKVRFAYTWVDGETWTILITSSLAGNITLGAGAIAGKTFQGLGKMRQRVFVGFDNYFAFSAITDPSLWEEQDVGAGVQSYVSQYGVQDTVQTFATFQGKLVVFGSQSIQTWSFEADPANSVLDQVLDNTGTLDPLSVQNIGDLDVLFLDTSGVRSVRSKELTRNAYINDDGVAIDSTIREKLKSYTTGTAISIVEPTTRHYWLWLYDTLFVRAHYPQSKISAWSTYKPSIEYTPPEVTDYPASGFVDYTIPGDSVERTYHWTKGANETSAGYYDGLTYTAMRTSSGGFTPPVGAVTVRVLHTVDQAYTGTIVQTNYPLTPRKFVVHGNRVYVLATDGKVYLYGGADNETFDRCRTRIATPWLNFGHASTFKQIQGLDAAIYGNWDIYASANPRNSALTRVISRGVGSTVDDSTFDVGHFSYSGHGTHVKIQADSYDDLESKLGRINILYSESNVK